MKTSKGKIIYVGNFMVPDFNAAGKRVYSIGDLLKNIGYDVYFIGFINTKQKEKFNFEELPNGTKSFKIYRSQSSLKLLNHFYYFNIVTNIFNEIKLVDVDYIIYYGTLGNSLFVSKLLKFANKMNIKVIADVVDLLLFNGNFIYNGFKRVNDWYLKKILNNKTDSNIVISSRLKQFYLNKRTVIIPPLMIGNRPSPKIEMKNDKISFIYSGSFLGERNNFKKTNKLKERFDIVIKTFAMLSKTNKPFILNIYGFTIEELLRVRPEFEKYTKVLDGRTIFHGKVSSNDYISALRNSDFSIIVRDSNRMSDYGFPTKVAESIHNCIPVITTRTSDIEDYLKSDEQAFYIEPEVDSLLNKINHIMELTKKEIYDYKQKCGDINAFNPSFYKYKLISFLYDDGNLIE